LIRLAYWLTAGAIGALAVHIVMIFAIPSLAGNDLTSRFAALGPANAVTILDEETAANTINYADRTALYAVCPFDLGDGPIGLVAEPGEAPMSFVFLAPGGTVFAALTDKASAQGLLQIRLLTDEQLRELVDSEDDPESVKDLRLASPGTVGAVLVKAFKVTESRRVHAETAIRNFRCGPI
jgi:uncharacterized membrane protein